MLWLLAGCASTAIDDNYRSLEAYGNDKLGTAPRWLQSDADRERMATEVAQMLATPLALADAERIALGYSPAFQVVLAEAAAASADATRAARIGNPVFTFEHLWREHDGERELDIGRALSFSLFDILLLPARREQAEFRQRQTRLEAAAALVDKTGEVRQAWVEAVAARQLADYRVAVAEAAEVGAELARRMQQVGNFSRLQRAREQLAYADAVAELARARQRATGAREALIRVLGLPAALADRLELPARLPDPPEDPPHDGVAGLQRAMDERLDLRLARAELDRLAAAMGLTRVTSVVDGMHLSIQNNSETGEARQRGYEIELPLPLFDFGDATRAGARARYLAALNGVAEVGRRAGSELREARAAYRSAWALERHYREEVVPLRETISEEMLYQYNGMLTGIFELLADGRARVAAVISAIEARRDLWLADAALKTALLGSPAPLPAMRAGAAAVAESGGGH
ncbi:MAG: TolC family protein [Rhodocyclaceae bacterium]|nr:TolC family protein [Rhodocyclaceae bacterium]